MRAVFTGIIEEIGTVAGVQPEGGGIRLTIEAEHAAAELKVNDSVSVNGVCQTVIGKSGRRFTMQAVEETLGKTTMGKLAAGAAVNLELPVRLNDRLGGHLVQGHVDCVGTVTAVETLESSRVITVEYPASFSKYVIPVGSVAMDGISLTVASKDGNRLTVAIIPHTLEKTTIGRAALGMEVNLEFDVIGKYIESLLAGADGGKAPSSVTAEKLRAWGYKMLF
jgi:riboflavin synthase